MKDTGILDELEEAGISRAECDGKHKDWVCSYCNQLNNWSDETCAACSAPKTESEFEYGMRKRKAEDSGKDTTDLSETADIEEEDSVRWQDTGNDDNDFSSGHVNADTKHGFDWKKKLVAALGGCIPLFALLAFLFWPVKEEIRVSGFPGQGTSPLRKRRRLMRAAGAYRLTEGFMMNGLN